MSQISQLSTLNASYTQTSTDSNSTLLSARLRISQTDSVWTRLISLIHTVSLDAQDRTEGDRTAGKIPVQLAPLQV